MTPKEEDKALSLAALLSTYLPATLLALGVGIALPAIPVLAKSFDVGFGVASLVITAFLGGGVLGTVPTERGTFLGLWRFTGQLGQTLSPIVFAVLAEQTGYGSSFVFVALAALVTALLLLTRVPETGRQPAPRERLQTQA